MTLAEKLQKVAENAPKVFAAGRQAESDLFWDAFQQKGQRTSYRYAFYEAGWTFSNLKPRYSITPSGNCRSMFERFSSENDQKSLVAHLNELGVELDLCAGTMTSAQQMFYNTRAITEVPKIDFTSCTENNGSSEVFRAATNLRRIEGIVVGENNVLTNCFVGCTSLAHVIFEGVLAQNGLNMSNCPLDKESIESVVSVLSTTTSGLSVTLSKSAVNKAFETSVGANNGSTSAEWLALVATRSKWTISLA